MTNLLRAFSLLALLAVLSTLAPAGAFAQTSCTDEYISCLNDSGQLAEPFRSMGDVECGMQYTGCVARKLKFW